MFRASNLILAFSSLSVLSVASTYALAVAFDHVLAFWPYISHTGNYPIESCIFSVSLNLISGLYVLIVFIRYWQVLEEGEQVRRRLTSVSIGALVSGTAAGLGVSIAASFQQRLFSFFHFFGATLCITSTQVFLSIQTWISYTYMGRVTSGRTKKFRAALLFFCCSVYLGYMICFVLLVLERHHYFHWDVNEKYYGPLNVSTAVLEWLLFTGTLLYFLSFYHEFTRIGLQKDRIVLLNLNPNE